MVHKRFDYCYVVVVVVVVVQQTDYVVYLTVLLAVLLAIVYSATIGYKFVVLVIVFVGN